MEREPTEQFLLDPCAARAAQRAGYSKTTADRIGSRLLKKVEILAAVSQAQDARAQRTQIIADRVLQELALIGFGRMGDFFDSEGRLKDVVDLPPHAQARLSSIDVVREKTRTTTDGADKTSVTESVVKLKSRGQDSCPGTARPAPGHVQGQGRARWRGVVAGCLPAHRGGRGRG